MKSYRQNPDDRSSLYEMPWATSVERSKVYEELGFQELSYAEILRRRELMSQADYEAWREKYEEKRKEADEVWSSLCEKEMSNKTIELNIRNNSLDAFCSVFQRADRILTGLSNCVVEVHDSKDEQSPAWSDGKSVVFNVGAIKEVNEDSLVSLHGLNYHEVGHLLYTPRVGSELGAWVKEKSTIVSNSAFNPTTQVWDYKHTGDVRIRYAFNLLEDFRVENYLIAKYPSVEPFLRAVVAEYAIDKFGLESSEKRKDELAQVFILLAGRAFMPKEVVKATAQLYSERYGVEATTFLYKVANEYRKLVFPKDYSRAKEIIELVANYLPAHPELPSGCGHRPVLRNGRVEAGSEQEQVAGQGQDDSLSLEELNKLFDDIMSGNKDSDNPNAQAQGQGQGNTHDPNETGELGKNQNNALAQSLAEKLEKTFEEAKTNPTVQDKVKETNKTIRKNSNSKTILPRQSKSLKSPNLSDVQAVRSFAQELERIRIDNDPDWKRELPTGKLNVRRAINADVNDINKLFDRWQTGSDDHDIEAIILLDRSGSMWNSMEQTCKASWIIKRALEKINASVSVLTFNDTSKVLYSADEKAQASYPVVQSTGGTSPEYALTEAERIMTNSQRKTKLLFLLTDGQFYGGTADETIQRIKAIGVHTNLVFLGEERWAGWVGTKAENIEKATHGVHNFRAITKPLDLVKVAKDVVRFHLKHTH